MRAVLQSIGCCSPPSNTAVRNHVKPKHGSFKQLTVGMRGVDAIVADSAIAFCRHTHDQFGIGLMDRGGQKSSSGRGIVEAGPGDIITVNPAEVHDGAPIGSTGRSWRMLYIEPSLIAEAATDITGSATWRGEFSTPVVHDRRLALRFARLFHAATHVAASQFQLDEALLFLLAPLVRRQPPTPSAAPVAIRSARSRMDDDPAATASLAELAATAGLSRYQFLRAFAQLTGLTPHAYLVQRRVHLARQLIGRGTKLADAAAASGFADQSHMTRAFVRRFGIAPAAYAKALR